MNGLLLIDKPVGPTSHDLVNQARRWCQARQIGHTGTLDPLASGLVILCVGWATRLSEYLLGHDKRYLAQIRFGQATDTYDAEGRPTATSTQLPSLESIQAALPHFQGAIQQVPPAFSAIKKDGQPLYKAARRGEMLEIPARTVTIFGLEVLAWQAPDLHLAVHCGAGTYIRSLAHDLGQKVDCPAHLAALQRTHIGEFSLEQAHTPSAYQQASQAATLSHWLLPADRAVSHLPAVYVNEWEYRRLCNGGVVALHAGNLHGEVRLYTAEGAFFAIGRADSNLRTLQPQKVLVS
ncbi:MAG TPA: tRNA pseudouridine(55) synthase TruB [Anaerolineales bacterium]|nr:tRNA pseudouridine(55) synthase TruB [Anaerolineales bacterium]